MPRLAVNLALQANDTIKVGVAALHPSAFLEFEPDSPSEWSIFAPRLLMRLDDVEKTKVIQPGSRISYHWAMTGSSKQVASLRDFVESQKISGVKILSAKKDQSSLENSLTRANDYFNLAGLVSMALAAIACAISIKRYTERHFRYVALLRTFGMVQAQILRVYLWNVLGWGLIAALLGGFLGIAGQWVLDRALTQFITIPLPPISMTPIINAILLALITLIGVGLPHLLQLKNVPTMTVLHNNLLTERARSAHWYVITFLFVTALSYFSVRNLTVWSYFLASVIGMTILLLIAGWLMLAGLRRIQSQLSSAWRFGIANVHRDHANSLVLLVGFGLSIMVLLLMIHVQSGLLLDWRNDLPKDTPNYFVINIPKQNISALENYLEKNHIKSAGFYPLVRGRLTMLNGQDIMKALPESSRKDESLQRALNFTWCENLPEHNRLYAGHWWSKAELAQPIVSVEHHFAERLNLHIGDEIGVTVDNQLLNAKITNMRDVNWTSFRPNFFMIFPPNMLDKFPATYMTSFYLPKQQSIVLTKLVENFPSASVLDVADITERLQSIINNIVTAILFILCFVFIASIAVLMAGIQANINDRIQASMILRALGATQRQLTIIMINEFLIIGAIAGMMAAIGAAIASQFITSHIFQLSNTNVWHLLLLGPTIGILLVTTIGLIASRQVLHQNAAKILRTFD